MGRAWRWVATVAVAMGCDAGGTGAIDASVDVAADIRPVDVAFDRMDVTVDAAVRDAGFADLAGCPTDVSALATINGTVYNTLDGAPMAGIAVSVEDGCVQLRRTTAANGGYGLRLPVGETVFLRAESDVVLPQLRGLAVPAEGSIQDFYVLPRAFFRLAAASAGVTPDPAKGHVWVSFENARHAGYGAVLSAAATTVLTRAAEGEAMVRSNTTLASGAGHWFLVFANVDAGTTTITPTTPAGLRCTPRQPLVRDWIVRAGAVTYYEADCD